MKVLGINGSPKRNGFTARLLDSALEGSQSAGAHTERVDICGLDIKPCDECDGCARDGKCVIHDDMDMLAGKVREADAVIVASPVFFTTITAQLKAMIDRFQDAWISKYLLNSDRWSDKKRAGFFICVSGYDRKEFFENSRMVAKAFFLTLNINYAGDLFFGPTNGMAEGDKRGVFAINDARGCGEALVEKLKEITHE